MTSPKMIGVRIDIETRSSTPVKYGSYKYAESDDFEVLVIGYSPIRKYPGGAVKLGQPRTLNRFVQRDVDQFASVIRNPAYEKHAFNANFERVCLSRWSGLELGKYIDPANWHCSAIKANVNGVFGTLAEVSKALRSPVDKDKEGKRLIRLFSIPETKTGRFHSTGDDCWCGLDHAEDFVKFEDYCKQDVVAEAMIDKILNPMPAHVQAEYEADQRINDRGFKHFKKMSVQAVTQVEVEKDRLFAELTDLTGIVNPNSVPQFKAWLNDQGYPMTSTDKAHREEAMLDALAPDTVKEALTLKGAASLSSVTKHKAALNTRGFDGRIRGALQFYGAHTGREAGRGIQPQNLPRYEAPRADMLRLLRGTAGADAPLIAKGSVRASIVPARGHVFIVFDYNAIEARTLGWATGEDWVNAEFAGEGKIYEATAATMFGIDKAKMIKALSKQFGCDKCGKCQWCDLRARGKVSNLALSYQGGAGALVTMGAAEAGIDIGNYAELHAEWVVAGRPGRFYEFEPDRHDYPELKYLRDKYREASPKTVQFWKTMAKAFDMASEGRAARFGPEGGAFAMIRDGRHNRLILPSGRSIWYRNAKSYPHPDYPDKIDRRTFMGKAGGIGHVRTDTHGGKLTENINQAIARDVLFELIMRIEAQPHKPGKIVLHVHDEVVLEVPEAVAQQRYDDIAGMMSVPPKWAPGLLVKGAGNIMERYGK